MNQMNIPNGTSEFEHNEISIKELVFKIKNLYHYIFRKRKQILLVGLLLGAINFTYSVFQKTVYNAELTFALEDEKSGGGGLSGALGLASSFGIDLGGAGSAGGAFSGANLISLMKSRKIVEKTLLAPVSYKGKVISFVDCYIDFNELRKSFKWQMGNSRLKKLHFPLNYSRTEFSLLQDSVLKVIFRRIINENLSVFQADKKISIISVGVSSKDEIFSKEFCEILAKTTSNYYIEIKSKKAKLNVDILQKQADSIRTELNSAITGVAAASDNVYNLNPAFNIKKTPSTRRQVDVQANTAILTQLVANLELAKVSLRKETPLIQIIDSPILPLDFYKENIYKSFVLGFCYGIALAILFLIAIKIYRKILI